MAAKVEIKEMYKRSVLRVVTPVCTVSSLFMDKPSDKGKYGINFAFDPSDKQHADFLEALKTSWTEYYENYEGEVFSLGKPLTAKQRGALEASDGYADWTDKETGEHKCFINVNLGEKGAQNIVIKDANGKEFDEELTWGSQVEAILQTWGVSGNMNYGKAYPMWNVKAIRVVALAPRTMVDDDFGDENINDNGGDNDKDDDMPF